MSLVLRTGFAPVGEGLAITAPAKINLWLEITGRRADGYHLLDSLFAFTLQGDRLEVEPGADISLSLLGPEAGQLMQSGGGGSSNLVVRAALALAEKARVSPRVRLTLTKNLPVASGIGGGSSDAASALLALNAFWQARLRGTDLEALAARLGADVPSLLYEGALWVQGVGEQLTPAPYIGPRHVVLVNPRVPVATPDVFRAFKESGAVFARPPAFDPTLPLSLDMVRARGNGLEAAAVKVAPVIARVLDTLRSLTNARLVRMSGSGATCFALFDGAREAQAAGDALAQEFPDWWVKNDCLQVSGEADFQAP